MKSSAAFARSSGSPAGIPRLQIPVAVRAPSGPAGEGGVAHLFNDVRIRLALQLPSGGSHEIALSSVSGLHRGDGLALAHGGGGLRPLLGQLAQDPRGLHRFGGVQLRSPVHALLSEELRALTCHDRLEVTGDSGAARYSLQPVGAAIADLAGGLKGLAVGHDVVPGGRRLQAELVEQVGAVVVDPTGCR